MKNVLKKAVGLVITTALLMTTVFPTACMSREARDTEAIKYTATRFFEAFNETDSSIMEELVDGDFLSDYMTGPYVDIRIKLASETKIEEFKSIDINRDNNTARARLKISYIDVFKFSKTHTGYKTSKEYLEELDSYSDREETNLTLNFTYDKDEDRWMIKKSSAEKYMELFDNVLFLNIASISKESADMLFSKVCPALADGQFDQPFFEFNLGSMRVFDDRVIDDPMVLEAVEAFTQAYFGYIVDHGITIETADDDYLYSAVLTGTAPSKAEILEYFTSDEFLIESYMYTVRLDTATNPQKYNEYAAQMCAEIYYDLAKQIPSMNGEDYSVRLSIDPTVSDSKAYFDGSIIPISDSDVYIVASQVSDDQMVRCYQKAVENLYLAGEITQEQYENLLSNINQIKNANYDTNDTFVTTVSWEGTENHANQAVNVYEYIPEWSDKTFYYGKSEIDPNGIFMHYSKNPEWLDTAGYCIADDGITVMVRFNHKFEIGTELAFDWYIGGDIYGTTEKYIVEEDGAYIFEFTIPVTSLDKYQECEFRLWEKGHSHVVAYVKLTQT